MSKVVTTLSKRFATLIFAINIFFNLAILAPFGIINVFDKFSDKKVPPWLAERGWTMTYAIGVWLGTAFVLTVVLVVALYVVFKYCLPPDDSDAAYYERKPLKPNLIEQTPENVSAHQDIHGVIVKSKKTDRGAFSALVLPFVNRSRREKVAPLARVSFRTTFKCFEGEQTSPLVIPRGSWLSERNTEIDFLANCPPQSAIIATIENEAVYAIRRDDSGYKGVITTRENLHGTVFGVNVELLAPSFIGAVKKRAYILEIIRERNIKLKLTYASTWQAEHLLAFMKEGYDFLAMIHRIWEDAHKQVPFPPVDTNKPLFPNDALSRLNGPEPFDYAAAIARVQAIEREQEKKLLEMIKNWETKTADFVKLYLGSEQYDQFVNSVPSIETGFNRVEKSIHLKLMLQNESAKDEPPELPYWRLSDAVRVRTDRLMSFNERILQKRISN